MADAPSAIYPVRRGDVGFGTEWDRVVLARQNGPIGRDADPQSSSRYRPIASSSHSILPVAGWRERCRYRADILDVTSTVNGSPQSTVFVGGAWVLTEKRYSVRFAPYLLRTPRPDSSTRSSVTPAQRKPMRPQRPRSLPTARATTARPRSAILFGSAEGRPRVPIGRIVMAPR